MTSLVAGFVCKLHNSLSNAVFLKQLVQIGFLAHFESLLSTNGRNFIFWNYYAQSFPCDADGKEFGQKAQNGDVVSAAFSGLVLSL